MTTLLQVEGVPAIVVEGDGEESHLASIEKYCGDFGRGRRIITSQLRRITKGGGGGGGGDHLLYLSTLADIEWPIQESPLVSGPKLPSPAAAMATRG